MLDGIINFYKPKDYTSHDAIAVLRGILKYKKMGHTGTLDPMAEGVLPICLGSATRLCDMMTEKQKTYVADFVLGIETDTEDITGEVLYSTQMKITKEELLLALKSHVGTFDQLPPMYSAVRVGGKRLYEYARESREIERTPRKVTIDDIRLMSIKTDEDGFVETATIEVECKKGTYIRSLIRDIGHSLSGYACMTKLTRTRAGIYTVEKSYTFEDLSKLMEEGRIEEILDPIDEFFDDLPKIYTKKEWDYLLDNGNPMKRTDLSDKPDDDNKIDKNKQVCEMSDSEKDALETDERLKKIISGNELFRMYDSTGLFYAVYKKKTHSNFLFPDKMFIPDHKRKTK